MAENRGNKVTGIRQIVRLKELLHKWQFVTLSSPTKSSRNLSSDRNLGRGGGGISPAVSERWRRSSSANCFDSDEDRCQSPEPPLDVPKGYLAVYVGPELRRFIIPTTYLSRPVFKVLLEKVEEEFGFDRSGGLTIPCEIETFKYLLKYMETHKSDADQPAADNPAGTSDS